jgi:hypothetical protein
MSRRLAATLTLTALASLSAACFSWRTKDVRVLAEPLPENTMILSVLKISGEVVLFLKSSPGRLRSYMIVGVGRDEELKSLELAGPFKIMKDAKGRIYEVTDGKGQVYTISQVLSQNGDRMSVQASVWTPVAIPLAEARQIEIRKNNILRNLVLVSGGLVAITFLPILIPHIF